MVNIAAVYYIVEIAVGVVIIVGAVAAAIRWARKSPIVAGAKSVSYAAARTASRAVRVNDDSEQDKIACSECQTIFKPRWKERETYSGEIIEYAVCPQCGTENEFEVVEDEDDEDN